MRSAWSLACPPVVAMLVMGGCATSSVYQLTVSERGGMGRMGLAPVEGAIVEVTQAGSESQVAIEPTNLEGESSFHLWDHQRYFVTVTFDGTTDRYLLRTDAVPDWDDQPISADDPRSPLRFAPGAPCTHHWPMWSVTAVRLR